VSEQEKVEGIKSYEWLSVFFFLFVPRNEHFCAYVPRKRHCATAHKPVCVRGICKGEGGKCQNKKRLKE
jgi:hypothetical protein